MAQKAIEGANVTCWNMHVILRWLKIRYIEFPLKFGSCRNPELAHFLVRESRDGSKFEEKLRQKRFKF